MRRPLILFGDLSNGGVRAVSELEREFSEVEEGTLLSHVKAAREGKFFLKSGIKLRPVTSIFKKFFNYSSVIN